jgi:hypothetical protein
MKELNKRINEKINERVTNDTIEVLNKTAVLTEKIKSYIVLIIDYLQESDYNMQARKAEHTTLAYDILEKIDLVDENVASVTTEIMSIKRDTTQKEN